MSAPSGFARSVRADRLRATVVAVIAVVGVLWPLGRELKEDSFPFSNFPMFTHNPGRTTGFDRAVGIRADGGEVGLSPELAGGTVEVIHTAQTLTNAIRRGEADELCVEVAERVARSNLDVVEIVVVTDRYDIVGALQADDPDPVSREEHARCTVGDR